MNSELRMAWTEASDTAGESSRTYALLSVWHLQAEQAPKHACSQFMAFANCNGAFWERQSRWSRQAAQISVTADGNIRVTTTGINELKFNGQVPKKGTA